MAQSVKSCKDEDLSSYPWLPGISQVWSQTSITLALRIDTRFSTGTEPIQKIYIILKWDLLDQFTPYGLVSPTMDVFTLERLRTCNCSVHEARCLHSLRVQKSQRLPGLPSVCVGRLKKLGSDVSKIWWWQQQDR